MPPVVDLEAVWNFATALLIGALLGIERERHKREHDEQTIGGLRTFILFALIGALGGWLTLALDSPWILAAALLASLAPVLAGYVISARTQPDALGLTTELAAVAACLLGAMTTLGYRELAVGLGVTVAAVLAYKQPLHGMVQRLDRDDVYAGLRLLIATFIVLPLLPGPADRPVGRVAPALAVDAGAADLEPVAGGLRRHAAARRAPRHSADRPHRRPRLVDGRHAGLRAPEPRSGLRGRRARARERHPARVGRDVRARHRRGAGGEPRAARPAAAPFAAMAVVAAARRLVPATARPDRRRAAAGCRCTNPFSLTAAAKFAAFFAAVLLVVKLVQAYAPGQRRVLRRRARRHHRRRCDHAVDGAVRAQRQRRGGGAARSPSRR